MIPRLLSSTTAVAIGLIAMTAAARADDTIIVGFGGGLTGALAYYDGLVKNGAQMAVDEINAAGGIAGKYKIDFRVKDVRSEPAESAAAGRAFVAAGAKVLIAPCDLETAVAFGRPAQQARIPIVAPCASTPTLAAAVGDFMVQIYPSDNLQGAALARFARDQGYRTAYVLQSPDTPSAEKLPLYFADAFVKMRGTLAGKTSYPAGQQEYGAVIAFIRNASPAPDVIMTSAAEPEFPLFLSQLRDAGVTTPVLAGDAVDSPTTLALGAVAEGVVYTSAAYPTPGGALDKFDRDYGARFGGDAQAEVAPYAATAYETIKLIEAAIAKAGSTDGAAIRDALDGIADFQGVTGSRITLAGAHGIALRDVPLIRVEKGRKTLVKMLRPEPGEVPAPQ
jgi:branched-chain amino acid transport system substrate-binding protein